MILRQEEASHFITEIMKVLAFQNIQSNIYRATSTINPIHNHTGNLLKISEGVSLLWDSSFTDLQQHSNKIGFSKGPLPLKFGSQVNGIVFGLEKESPLKVCCHPGHGTIC